MENVLRADGVAIAWAVSEELIGLGAYTLFATHFTALSELAELYPNAKLWHFTVDSSAEVMITLLSRIKHGRRMAYVPADTIQMPSACLEGCRYVTDGTVPLGRRRFGSALCIAAGACKALFESSKIIKKIIGKSLKAAAAGPAIWPQAPTWVTPVWALRPPAGTCGTLLFSLRHPFAFLTPSPHFAAAQHVSCQDFCLAGKKAVLLMLGHGSTLMQAAQACRSIKPAWHKISDPMQVGLLEEVMQEAHRIAELVEQADSRTAATSAVEEADELRAGMLQPYIHPETLSR